MAAKNVGVKQFDRHPLLPGVDDLGLRRDSRDLGDVLRFDGITEDDSRHAATAAGEVRWFGIL